MTSVPEFLVAAELADLREVSTTRNWNMEVIDSLSFLIGFPASNGKVYWCKVICEGYKTYPPKWHWYNPVSKKVDDLDKFPLVEGDNTKYYFHPTGVICAPWNLLSYTSYGPRGLHADWNIIGWQSNPLTGISVTLSAMANQIHQEFRNEVVFG